MKNYRLILSLLLLFVIAACDNANQSQQSTSQGSASEPQGGEDSTEFQQKLLAQLIGAKPGDVITIPAGRFSITRGLTLNVSGVTIKGAGMDKSVLSFKQQIQGAEGLLVNASDIVLQGFAVEDTKGDAIKVNEGKNLTIRAVRTEWTNGPDSSNGSYGIYPVQMENVLIEDCVAIGASDAGIYVGQSNNIVVRRNRAELNVAGIEIENSTHADVYENITTNNTGGILVFNMPNLPQPGHSTRVYNNTVNSNNTKNFGAKGTPVASVPAGSGVVINSNDKVEIFDNTISDNKTANILITSYFTAGYFSEKSTDKDFDPYPESIFIYGNTYAGGGDSPDDVRLKALRLAMFGLKGSFPNIVWDGVINPASASNGKLEGELAICVDNAAGDILNLDAANDFANPAIANVPHRCELAKLPATAIPQA